MEIFRGYVSLGGHAASEGIPRLPQVKQSLLGVYQPGARNIYYEESSNRPVKKLERLQQILLGQPIEGRSIFRAQQHAERIPEEASQAVKKVLAQYKSDLSRYGPLATRRAMSLRAPELESSFLFSIAEYEMLDTLPKELNLYFTGEAFTPKDLAKSDGLIEKYYRLDTELTNCIMLGRVDAAVSLCRKSLVSLGNHLRFRNSRTVDTWNEFREQAVRISQPTRLGSRFGLAHASFRDRLPVDEWTFESDFDPFLSPQTRLAIACELDPKQVPTDDEISAVLLEIVSDVRLQDIDASPEDCFIFLQKLLQLTTPKEIKKLVKSQATQDLGITFDAFVRERDLALPGVKS